MVEKRLLEQTCNELDFTLKLLNQSYCGIGFKRKIDCLFQDKTKDHNELYKCMNPLHNPSKDWKPKCEHWYYAQGLYIEECNLKHEYHICRYICDGTEINQCYSKGILLD
jgi:hypothetical protein